MNNLKTHADFVSLLKNTVQTIRQRIQYRSSTTFEPDLREVSTDGNLLTLTFSDSKVSQDIYIPIPVVGPSGNTTVESESGVIRAVGTWMVGGVELSFWSLMGWLFTARIEEYIATSSKRIYLERLLRSFQYEQAPNVFRNFQKIIDEFVNGLPLVSTEMETWAMCNRIQIIDPVFDKMTPKEKLEYQRTLNEKAFPLTSLGQSDSGMCNNTLLKVDVRKTVPYGISHHNPRRNLYQTLGMEGEETPSVMSITEADLADQGIVRKGWNLMTLFVDLPLNFEDQIIVSNRLKNLFITEHRKFTCHGHVIVNTGDDVRFLHPLSIEPDGTVVRFHVHADSAVVEGIENSSISFNGGRTPVKIITIKMKRLFKDGFKLTNRHGNKGIIKLEDTGVVHDPIRGDIPIDIIVSARSVQKRKNFGQLLEALTTLLHGKNTSLVVRDNVVIHTDKVKKSLTKAGYQENCALNATTKWGKFKGVAGWIHWGVIKTPEDQLWSRFDTRVTNARDVRIAGNKFSHIEARGLITMFGRNNPVLNEVMEHRQGLELAFESMRILGTLNGNEPQVPTISYDSIKVIDQSSGIFHDMVDLSGTVADITIHPDGFFITLPDSYRYVIRKLERDEYSEEFTKEEEIQNKQGAVILSKIFVPASVLRAPWKHRTGKYGLSDVAALINTIVSSIDKFKRGVSEDSQIGRAIYLYFHGISSSLSEKTGLISNYCLSVRYPWTAKATAAVAADLAENEIEIYKDMAKDLKVHTGDFVLAERYPCLGFMSLRVQRVKVTEDEECRYVIRVSGNSLASQNLDFDGDVIYLMSFHSPEAKEALKKEFESPNKARLEAYRTASQKKIPCTKEMVLDEYGMEIFPTLTAAQNAEIVEGLTGIKRGTGTIIAMCYNIMRIAEGILGYKNDNLAVSMEKLIDKVANSVFSMKHAGRSLEAECREAICTADIEKMIALGLDPEASAVLSEIILRLAQRVGFSREGLVKYYYAAEAGNKSSIVNIIVRNFHKIWFTTRANLHPITMMKNFETEPEDLAGHMFSSAKKRWEGEKRVNQGLGTK